MLQRQEEAQTAAPPVQAALNKTAPAATQRVTPEELSAALEALESSKQEQARQVQNTVAIGEVVDELGLNVTSEEVWEQVQKQRTQTTVPPPPAAAESKLADTVNETLHAAAQHARKAVGQAAAAAQAAAAEAREEQTQREAVYAPRRRRGFRGGGIALAFLAAGWVFFSSNHGVMVNSDHAIQTVGGHRGLAMINGDNDTVTVTGTCDTLVVSGDHDHITVAGKVRHIVTFGDHNNITWSAEDSSQAPTITDNGDGNRIEPAPPDTP